MTSLVIAHKFVF